MLLIELNELFLINSSLELYNQRRVYHLSHTRLIGYKYFRYALGLKFTVVLTAIQRHQTSRSQFYWKRLISHNWFKTCMIFINIPVYPSNHWQTPSIGDQTKVHLNPLSGTYFFSHVLYTQVPISRTVFLCFQGCETVYFQLKNLPT